MEKYGYKSNQPYFKTHTLIFDEADLLLDEQFYEQTNYICSKISSPFVQIIAVSATFIKPQLKSFENMICELDHNYINKFVKTHSNITEDIIGTNHILRYYVSHLLLSNKIVTLDYFLNYLSGYERVFEMIIHSSSNGKSPLEIKTRTCDEYNQSIINDTDGDVDLDTIVQDQSHYCSNDIDSGNASHGQDMSSVTSVIDKITFYFSLVKDAPNIVMQIGYKIEVLVKLLANVKYKKCIIFSNQSHIRLQIYGILKYLGYTCYIISSRISHAERVMMLYDLNSVENVVILCTDVMSRGIGLSNVELVINMDIPGSKEIFLHRSGRSGRFGSKGVCVSICMESELETYNYFVFALNFKSIPVDAILDSDVSVNGIVSDHLMNAIDFVNLQDELPGIKNIINPSLPSLMLNTEEYKFNVSIVGFISDTDIMLFNTGNTQFKS
ncbi:hypothetical protein MACJ_003162 [Theileria orientalis]|uniref:ATP-dependent RNA helicase n=1 Tax=Theileria orientalis TaxID=68886 RepID=A0A976M7H6_THEOR|nr:hypothetical protein MACJ_003162 [Theileria orientalis]